MSLLSLMYIVINPQPIIDMKNVIVFFKQLLLTGIILAAVSCKQTKNDQFPDPIIQSGIAKLTGKLIHFQPKKGEENPTLTLYVPNPITSEMVTFETKPKNDGIFLFEVPVESNITMGHINSPAFNYHDVCVGLIPGKATSIEITFDTTGPVKANMVGNLTFNSNDLMNYGKMVGNFMDANGHDPLYKMTPLEFSHFVLDQLLPKRLKVSITDSTLSPQAKNYITNQCKLFFLNGCLLKYPDFISLNYHNFKPKGAPEEYTPQVPGKSYYALLKSFDLNDPQYLYNESYGMVLQTLLSNETLNIPAIKDTPVKEWLTEVKKIMADLIGSDTGMFYDMLAINSYTRQLNRALQPLSDKQKANITVYFTNPEVTKILFRKNDEIVKLAVGTGFFKTVINKTPAVTKDKLMKAIVSKYKGKAVLVDFWATWCGPCMEAMKEVRKVKNEMQGKNIAFVYITNVSSPLKLWNEDIVSIGGEQYYLTAEEWKTIMDSFGFTGIPSYLFYDTKGVLKNKVTAYPGKEKMTKMIGELLL
jgi:thiol-disulfide isomerase/thioredoxin